MPITLDTIRAALAETGLAFRGAFHPDPEDGVPSTKGAGAAGTAGTLILAGCAGPDMWRAFRDADRGSDHPLDAWSRRAIGRLAERFVGAALFPGDGPPYLPFMRWAMRAEPVYPSEIGMLIHPDYGLWHSYRGALALRERLDLPPRDTRPRPCDSCPDKPCLSACPVDAFTKDGYDVPACTAHVAGADGGDCRDLGCRARRACPVGREYVYAPEQAAFHMAAFLKANRDDG